YFSDNHFQTTRFGKGWAWDDYPFTYQCERNAFPIYGNRIWIQRTHDTLTIVPSYLASVIQVVKDTFTDTGKSEWGDGYYYTYDGKHEAAEEEIPITFFKNDLRYCWSEATHRQIEFIDRPFIPGAIPIQGSLRDTLIKEMMFESDNLIAEQLLLSCSQKAFGEMNEELAIGKLLFGPLSEYKDDLEWVDGSGLSRYNLASPRSMIEVLSQMLRVKGIDYMKTVMPAGGKSGTLITDFKGKGGKPYIYAKSGSLKHTYCLSGILVTKSGKVLLFSWMNNQYHGSQRELKSGMEKIFSFLYDQY
ncbi:MAG TPA: D-alanyl-D-alanine carboxypeptidase, partial [Saprospiraceae bacterium]